MVAESPPMNEEAAYLVDNLYKDRLRTLVSVDDIVKSVYDTVYFFLLLFLIIFINF